MITTYECALTGISAEAGEAGPVGTLPPGWIKITFARQMLNPKWIAIQQLKEAMVNNFLGQIQKAEDRQIQQVAVNLQVEAQFAALEAQTQKYTLVEEVLYTAAPESDPSIREAFNAIREPLGLETFADADEAEEDEAEGDGDGPAKS
jgi:hypothetical protein